MKSRKNKEELLGVAVFRAPAHLIDRAKSLCLVEEITFSQLVRRSVRRELGISEDTNPKEKK